MAMVKTTGVDELRLIGLLWRDAPASPRSGISTRGITAQAVALADRDGLEAVTIRALAQEAGVTAMALYPHIGGRAELVELMLDHVAGTVYVANTPPGGPDWRARVTAVADANWASCQAHPWVTDLATGRPVPGPGAADKYETELRALEGTGLTDVEMEHTLTALLAMVQGTARAALAAQRARGAGEDADTGWWSAIEPTLTAAIGDPDRFPVAARVSRALGEQTGRANDPEGAYQAGLDLMLHGIAQAAAASS
ncbi:TetR/AcrR family transcriptional regulator [Luteipulveratus halotolerans]|uniref:TetR family transcriptional regulator n=1 Tax=Luteipulveratus halotolerans TaxID=1631356 RepID=A0A0L6CFT3_9MICO|nr:TetR/AcrR family transcriptional regulator [Luteipulveratus halotolerans]KNX36559.1 TetR family transcriptional regulator [Luteipulveratus halotolerans]